MHKSKALSLPQLLRKPKPSGAASLIVTTSDSQLKLPQTEVIPLAYVHGLITIPIVEFQTAQENRFF